MKELFREKRQSRLSSNNSRASAASVPSFENSQMVDAAFSEQFVQKKLNVIMEETKEVDRA